MANELSLTGRLVFNKGNVSISLAKQGLSVTVTGTNFSSGLLNVTTSETAIPFGSVATPGWALLKNHDSTNYVELRPATGVADLIRMNAGEFAGPFRFAADCTAPMLIANTATCEVEWLLIET